MANPRKRYAGPTRDEGSDLNINPHAQGKADDKVKTCSEQC
jgi:hypothetical protein